MSTIQLKQNTDTRYTLLKNTFIDYYMMNANGEYVKVYLYLLRCMGDTQLAGSLSVNQFADVFDCTEKDILRALKYWENAGLLTLEFSGDTISSILINDIQPPGTKSAGNAAVLESAASRSVSVDRLKALSGNKELTQLLYIAQTYMGKTLNATETNTILFFYDQLGFCADLIEYLLEYCATNNHKSFRYIEKVGLAWHEAGITSPSEAKEYVSNFSNTYFSVLKAFGISGRSPAQAEKDAIDRWTNQYGFNIELILEACHRTINAIHQPSFQYADSILKKWKDKNVQSIGDLKSLDSAHEKRKEQNSENVRKAQNPPVKKNAFNNFPQAEYNFDELEKALLKRG